VENDRLRLADPQLAVDLLCTLRHNGEELIDQLTEPSAARIWLHERLGAGAGELGDADLVEVVRFRDQLRTLFTAVVDGATPPPQIVAQVNAAAAQAPTTLQAVWDSDGEIQVERTVAADGPPLVHGELGRAALALLIDEHRDRLRLCRAPRCVLFFLKEHPLQEWCSPSCGNRARVARHFARHRAKRSN
jgi:predicted RNA-binding Zn ribbon-like protein